MRDDIATYPGRAFVMPADHSVFVSQFWTVRYAAHQWGCSYRTALRWMDRHPEACVMVRVHHANALIPRWRMCVPAGTEKVAAHTGNPDFLDSSWQRDQAVKRVKKQRAARLARLPVAPVPAARGCRVIDDNARRGGRTVGRRLG